MENLASKIINIYGDTNKVPQIKDNVLITNIKKVVLTDCSAESGKQTRLISMNELKADYIGGNENKIIKLYGSDICLFNATSVSHVNGSDEYHVGFGMRFTAIVRVSA